MRLYIADIGGETDLMYIHVEEDDNLTHQEVREKMFEAWQKAEPTTKYSLEHEKSHKRFRILLLNRADQNEWVPLGPAWYVPWFGHDHIEWIA